MSGAGTLPQSDLLSQVEGIETRLERGRRVGAVAWVVALVSGTVQVFGLITSIDVGQWPFLVAAVALVASVLLLTARRFWIRESEEPFRYTFWVKPFDTVTPGAEEELRWLRQDLLKKLSQRIRRLRVLEVKESEAAAEEEGGSEEKKRRSHIHIEGYYGKRWDPYQGWLIEVVPQVRVGRGNEPATVARPVRYSLSRSPTVAPPTGGTSWALVDQGAADDQEPELSAPPPLKRADYLALVERVYFTIATEIYSQIRDDVQRKIDLLPTSRLRGTAYLREADDYARSNTLDAYADAGELYAAAVWQYDRSKRPLPLSRLRRLPAQGLNRVASVARGTRVRGCRIWQRLARREVLTAQAEVGQANMLVTNFFLASLQGVKAKSAFAAREKSESAIVRLKDLPSDVRGVKEALFDAYVAHALAEHHVGDVRAADRLLWQARSLQPPQAETNPVYLFVAGLVEPRLLRKLRLLRRSAELDPDFELARAFLAFRLEELWRSRGQFEPSVARILCDEYESVVSLNPGNVGAWGGLGYVNWLLAGAADEGARVRYWRQSKRAFEAGRDYKQVRGETLTAELDHGLTRLAAEQGQFDEAYQYYLSTVSMQLSEYTLDYSAYFYGRGGTALLNRFSTYRRNVARQLGLDGAKPCAELDRVRRSVWAFVLNDLGQAQVFYYYRSGSQAALEEARKTFEEAAAENPDFVLPHYNLARLYQHLSFRDRHTSELADPQLQTAHEEIERCLRLEPEWPVAKLAMAEIEWEQARLLRTRETSLENEAEQAAQSRRTSIGMSGDGDAAGPISHGERSPDHKVADLQAEAARVREASGDLLDHAATALATLLPHPCFIDEGHSGDGARSLVDASGGAVERILTSDIAWRSELDQLHVDALVRWAQLLEASGTDEAVKAAEALTRHVELNFLPGDVRVLSTRRDAAGRLGLSDVAHQCAERITYVVKHELVGDPANYTVLLWSGFLDPREHVDALHRAIEVQGATGPTLVWLGQRFETEFSDAAAAARAYRGAMDDDDGQIACEAALQLGGLLARRGDPAGARDAYEAGTQSEDPVMAAQAAAQLGGLLDQAGEQEEKERIFKLVAGRSAQGAAELGSALEAYGDLDGAEAAYRAASRRKSKPAAGAALSLGGILERKGSLRGAEAAYRRASQSEESNVYAPAALRLGALLAQRGDNPGAEDAYRKASGSDDEDAAPDAAVRLGRLLDQRGAHDEAVPVYDHVAGLGALAAIRLGDLLAGRDPEAAEAAYLRGSEFDGDNDMPMALLRLGDVRQLRGDAEGAAVAWEEASNSDDSGVFPVASLRLADALAGSDREAAAEQAYRRAMESGDSEAAPRAAVKLFDMLTARGEATEAATLYESILALGARAAVTLGQLLEARGELQAAEGAYRRGASLDGDPYAPDAHLGLGSVLESRGDRKGAEEAYRRAVASRDWTIYPLAALRLGDLLSRVGDPAGAEDMYRQASESPHPGAYPTAALRLAECLSEKGDEAGAESAYRRAAESDDPSVAEEAEKRLAVPR